MKSEKIVLGQGTKYPLKGLLTLPDSSVPVPAVVFVHGSGSSNMDEKVGKLTPFRDLAEGLAKRGIASVRYDKRSYAHGLKLVLSKAPLTVREETIADAILAAKLLRGDKRIAPNRIFIIGHSMGAMLAPRIDAEGGDFRGLILMAGTLRKLEEVLLEQTEEIVASMKGFSKKLGRKQLEQFRTAFAGLYDLTDEQAKAKKFGGGTTLYYFKEMGEHPAAGYLEKMNKPILVMQGSRDVQVKADVDFAGYRELLSGRENVTFRLCEGLNHAFVPALCDSIADAKKEFSVERHIGSEVLDDITDWIHGAI